MTIERTEVNGKPATVCYIDENWTPTTPEKATMMTVQFDDGDTMVVNLKPEEAP